MKLACVAALAGVSAALRMAPPLHSAGGRAVYASAAGVEEEFVISLLDPMTGKVLPCYMASLLEKDGATFAALSPAAAPVSLAELTGDRLMPVEEETDELVAAARAACAEMKVSLNDTPVVLTVSGAGLDDLDYGELEDEEEDDGGEEAFVLTEFDFEGRDILVVQTLDPLYVVGKRVTERSYVIPSDDEVDAVSPQIEAMVAELADELEDAEELDDFDDEFDKLDLPKHE